MDQLHIYMSEKSKKKHRISILKYPKNELLFYVQYRIRKFASQEFDRNSSINKLFKEPLALSKPIKLEIVFTEIAPDRLLYTIVKMIMHG